MTDVGTTLEDLEQFLADHHLVGSGLRGNVQLPPHRTGRTGAHWGWDGMHTGLMQSARIVKTGARREYGVTTARSVTGIECHDFPIWMNMQMLMPGDRTHAHRTMRSETRLVCEAAPGASFVCEFEAFPMHRGDVIISPPWTFHDHWNQGKEPAIWVDAYDNGHNPYAGVSRFEESQLPNGAEYQEISRSEGYALATLGHAQHVSEEPVFPLPPMRYPWTETQAALDALRESEVEGDPYDGLHLMFTSPVDGGPTLPTMAWHVQLFRPREKTRAHRHNSTTFYHVFEGAGATEIEGERLEWSKGDLFAVPAWSWHHHENTLSDDAILFSVDDWPAMKKLGFYRKEEAVP